MFFLFGPVFLCTMNQLPGLLLHFDSTMSWYQFSSTLVFWWKHFFRVSWQQIKYRVSIFGIRCDSLRGWCWKICRLEKRIFFVLSRGTGVVGGDTGTGVVVQWRFKVVFVKEGKIKKIRSKVAVLPERTSAELAHRTLAWAPGERTSDVS